ncbi:MAG TPA: sulfotransferase [Gammaproteobacteria bacterium]|nr:sulfotransferase [Gammaproteobacteria bacterium]
MEDEWHQIVRRYQQAGDIDSARRACLGWLKNNSEDVSAWWSLAEINARLGLFRDAEICYRKVIQLNPESYTAYMFLGLVFVFLGSPAEAVKHILRAISINPEFAPCHDYLGCAYRDLGSFDEALESYRNALRINPEFTSARINLGNLLKNLGELEQAMECYEKVLAAEWLNLEALAGRASVLERRGDFDQAYQGIRRLIDSGAENPVIATVFAALSTRFNCQDEAISMLERVLATPVLAPVQRRELLFSLGRLYDAEGSYRNAFVAYKKANEVLRTHFDLNAFDRMVDAFITYFTRDKLVSLASVTNTSRRPIFIVGMPRSGTSLVEQVLASHPQIHGGGELDDIARLAGKSAVLSGGGGSFPFALDDCSGALLDTLAGEYLSHLDALSLNAKRITDKMPGNYLYLGFIQLLFPHARVVHCVRDPVDTCLSCYFQNFGAEHGYSGDLIKLGRVYRCYEKIMKHWGNVLTIPVYEVKYEDMVNNFESVSRGLVSFCGVEWNTGCLEFYQSKRLQNTASYDQVRHPVYHGSVRRRDNYAEFTGKLSAALDKECL